MREIRPYGSEGGVALTTPLLPLSRGTLAILHLDSSLSIYICPDIIPLEPF